MHFENASPLHLLHASLRTLLKTDQAWVPLTFEAATGAILPMTFPPSFTLDLANTTGNGVGHIGADGPATGNGRG